MPSNIIQQSNMINDNYIGRKGRSRVSNRNKNNTDFGTLYQRWEIHDEGLVFVDVDVDEYSTRSYIAFPFDT